MASLPGEMVSEQITASRICFGKAIRICLEANAPTRAAKGIPSNTCEMLSRCLPSLNLPLEAERKALAQPSPQCPLLGEDHNLARVVEDAAGRLPTK